MTAWMGRHAMLDPRIGGDFAVDIAGFAIRGEYLEVEQQGLAAGAGGHLQK